MNGSPSAIISLGLGSWGSPSLVVSLGFGVGEVAAPLQITKIIGGYFIPGATIGEGYAAGIDRPVTGPAAQRYAAGAVIAEGRFQ